MSIVRVWWIHESYVRLNWWIRFSACLRHSSRRRSAKEAKEVKEVKEVKEAGKGKCRPKTTTMSRTMTSQPWTHLRSVLVTAAGLSIILGRARAFPVVAIPAAPTATTTTAAFHSLLMGSLVSERPTTTAVSAARKRKILIKSDHNNLLSSTLAATASTHLKEITLQRRIRDDNTKSSALSESSAALATTDRRRRNNTTTSLASSSSSTPIAVASKVSKAADASNLFVRNGRGKIEGVEGVEAATKLAEEATALFTGGPSTATTTMTTAKATATAIRPAAATRGRRSRTSSFSGGTTENEMEKRQYYQTELLTVDEEYSLGMKVQFMVHCENVHRGLAAQLDRLPTFTEWAAACGFTEAPTSALTTMTTNNHRHSSSSGSSSGSEDAVVATATADSALDYLRPVGYEEIFEETDPCFFVGNGIVQESGPGRGCARRRSPPPLQLGDWYDDSAYVTAMRAYKNSNSNGKSLPKPVRAAATAVPLNRGDVAAFVELLNQGRDAKQRMIKSNMRLVVSIAGKYCRAGVGLLDLIQEGSIGLHRAARKYEPKKGFKFSTYASWWIQQAIFRSIAHNSRTIRLPVHIHNLLNKVRKIQRSVGSELQRKPTAEEMADRLGLSVRKYHYLIYLMKQTTSLDAPAYAQNPKDSYFASSDLLSDTVQTLSPEDTHTAEQEVDKSLFLKDLGEILATLDDDERTVINLRYGLRDGMCRSVTSIAATYNRSKEWVRSQECRGLRKLRRPWYEKKLREYQEALETSG
jgi:RNA polymerase sigma factor (sigma-70 family)